MTDSSVFFQLFILARDPENQLGLSTAIHLFHAIPCLALPTMQVKNIL
jgi:hypothetical protein